MATAALDVGSQRRLTRWFAGCAGGAGLAFVLGALTTPQLVWPHLLLMSLYMFGIGVGACLFLALTRLTGAKWCRSIQFVPETIAQSVPLVAPLLGAVALAGIYVRADTLAKLPHGGSFWFKDAWLQPVPYAIRTIVYLVVFSLFAVALARASRRDQAHRSVGYGRLSALFLVVFAILYSLASIDWLMALSPEWFSTMWGVYQFAGAFLGGLALVTVLAVLLDRAGRLPAGLPTSALHTLGILLFGFSCFWMYIWFSQYMLIWYTNMPEETFYFVAQTHGLWGPLFVTNLFVNWVIPFFILLPRPAKQNQRVMLRIAVLLLVGHWLDLYLAVAPPLGMGHPTAGFCELGSILGTIGLFGLMLNWLLRRRHVLA